MSARTRYCSRCLTTFTIDGDRCPNLTCKTVRPQSGWGEILESGETIDRTYRIRQRLAIGGAGVTYLAREIGNKGDEVGPLLAVKVLYQQRDQGPYLRRLATEAQILQGLNHAQIVECRGFVHRTGHSPYLVTRFEAGGSLLDHIRRVGTLSIPVTANIGRQVCWALEVAHRQHVVHRDLKPENVLLVKQVSADSIPDLKVADFGIAKVAGGVGDRLTRVGAFIGTPQYAAPEQFEGLAPEPAADIYALGAMMYFCLTARPVAEFMGELDPDDLREQLIRHLPVSLAALNAPAHLRRWMEDTLALAMTVEPVDRCDLATLDRRLADIASERDPGHVPVAPPRDLPTSTPTISAGMMENLPVDAGPGPADERPATDERVREERARLERARASVPLPNEDSASDAFVPDPAAGTADPVSPPPLPIVNLRDPISDRQARPPQLARVPEPASPVAPSPFPPSSADDRPFAGLPPRAEPPRIPRPEVRPDPRPTAFPEETPKRRTGAMLGVGAVGVLGIGGAVILLVVGVCWAIWGRGPRELTGQESDPAVKHDWELVASSLGAGGVVAEKTCNTPPYLAVEATVQPDGQVSHVELLNYDFEPARACMEQELGRKPLQRSGAGAVRVAVTLPK